MKRVIYIHSFLKAGDWSIVQYPVTFGGLRKPEGKVYPKKKMDGASSSCIYLWLLGHIKMCLEQF